MKRIWHFIQRAILVSLLTSFTTALADPTGHGSGLKQPNTPSSIPGSTTSQ